jgi:signal transduction histidine kinase
MAGWRALLRPHGDVDERRPVWVADLAVAVPVTALGLIFAVPRPVNLILALALSAPLAIRRAYPVFALVSATVAAVAQLLLLDWPGITIIAVPILVYSFARWSGRVLARISLGIALAGAVAGPMRWYLGAPEPVAPRGFLVTIAAYAGVVLVAYVVGGQGRERAQRERARHRAALAEQERRASLAAAGERQQIAGEVHDIVAHSLSTIVVQAEGGQALATSDPAKAAAVLGVISEAAREALDEMREMVALLRRGGSMSDTAEYRPTPGLTDLAELIGRSGDRARLRVHGEPPRLSPMLGLTAYRVVQESLTNFLRHAGPVATLDVVVACTEQAIEITARDDGRGAAAPGDGDGHGLATMRERVSLHGGTVTTGPRDGGGFGVHVLLPVGGSRS